VSIVTTVAVFFALNPDEELTAHDVGIKWDIKPNNVGASLKYAEQTGWVTRTKRTDLTARYKFRWIYTAGPLIKGMTTPSVSSASPGG
jgi:hypothetical protein